jgi:hypothetical protein
MISTECSDTSAAFVFMTRSDTIPSTTTIGKYEKPGMGIFPGSLMQEWRQNMSNAVIPERNKGK